MEPDDGLVPKEAVDLGLSYFLEVFIALDFIDGWLGNRVSAPSVKEQCDRLIRYAITDA